MNSTLNSLFDVLAYMLQALNVSESQLTDKFSEYTDQMESIALRHELDCYLGGLEDNRLGIKRIFSYLLKDKFTITNHSTREMIHEVHALLSHTTQSYLRDVTIVASVKSIIAYKISLYHTAYQIALELDLETPADILKQIIEREKNASDRFDRLSLTQFTNVQ